MKISELDEHCGNCHIIGYCTDPYESPKLCAIKDISDMDVDLYNTMADSVTIEEINQKIKEYEENDSSIWDDDYKGAILDIVSERWRKQK